MKASARLLVLSLFALVLVLGGAQVALAATLNVPAPYATIQDAVDAAAPTGDTILVAAGIYPAVTTIAVNKSVTIQGAGIGLTTVQTPGAAGDPVNVFYVSADNVTLKGMTIQQRKTTNTTWEAAICVGLEVNPNAIDGFRLEACRIETVEFGVILRGRNWAIEDNELAYVGPLANGNRLVGTYGVVGTNSVTGNTFECATDIGQTVFMFVHNSGGSVYSGTLNVSDNSQTSGSLHQFHFQDAFAGTGMTLDARRNTFDAINSNFILLASTSTGKQPLNYFRAITLMGNHTSNTGGKGLLGLDSNYTPAISAGNTVLAMSNNVLDNPSVNRSGYATATGSTGGLVGYKTAAYTDPNVTIFGGAVAPVDSGSSVVATVSTFSSGDVVLDFASVSSGGTAYASAVSAVNPPPSGYTLAGDSCFDLSTSALFSGTVDVTLPYDPAVVPAGKVGALKMYHWSGTTWEDITIPGGVDTLNHTVTGLTSSFSDFGLFYPTADPPSISSFTPTSGPAKTIVTITGTGFTSDASVTFAGIPASTTANADFPILARVPAGSATGPIAVTTPGGTVTSSGTFTRTATTWYVPGDCPTIQAAVDTATAGDTVVVAAGNYPEQILIQKSLTVVGAGEGLTTIQAPAVRFRSVSQGGLWDYIVAAYSPGATPINVSITGVTVDAMGRAKTVGTAGLLGVFLRDVSGTGAGLFSSTVHGFGSTEYESWAVRVFGASDLTINDNAMSDYTRDGIKVWGDGGAGVDPDVTISHNAVTGSAIPLNGIVVDYGAVAQVAENAVTGHTR
ncbi:MAG: IPT/TIG domain-containing protein, partial [Actinomycetes bacterium]